MENLVGTHLYWHGYSSIDKLIQMPSLWLAEKKFFLVPAQGAYALRGHAMEPVFHRMLQGEKKTQNAWYGEVKNKLLEAYIKEGVIKRASDLRDERHCMANSVLEDCFPMIKAMEKGIGDVKDLCGGRIKKIETQVFVSWRGFYGLNMASPVDFVITGVNGNKFQLDLKTKDKLPIGVTKVYSRSITTLSNRIQMFLYRRGTNGSENQYLFYVSPKGHYMHKVVEKDFESPANTKRDTPAAQIKKKNKNRKITSLMKEAYNNYVRIECCRNRNELVDLYRKWYVEDRIAYIKLRSFWNPEYLMLIDTLADKKKLPSLI